MYRLFFVGCACVLSVMTIRCESFDTYPTEHRAEVLDAEKRGATFSADKRVLLRCPKPGETKFVIPSCVTEISQNAFYYTKLTHVVIPDSVRKINDGAFQDAKVKVELSHANQHFILNSEGALIEKGSNRLIYVPGTEQKAYVIPESVVEVAPMSLPYSVESLTITKNVKVIDALTLHLMREIHVSPENKTLKMLEDKSVIDVERGELICLPDIFQRDAKNTFRELPRKNYVVPENVTRIGANAFRGTELQNIVFHEKLVQVGEEAFSNCRKLRTIKLPQSLKEIGRRAFASGICSCCGLTEITIPANVERIGEGAFSGIERVTLDASNKNFRQDRFGVLLDVRQKRLLYAPPNPLLKYYKVPEEITAIDAGAFMASKVSVVELSEHVSKIGEFAFGGCSSLNQIKLPEGLTQIGMRAFSDCLSLRVVYIPDSVTTIGRDAFHFCRGLGTIRVPKHFSDDDIAEWGLYKSCNVVRTLDPEKAFTRMDSKLGTCDLGASPLDGELPFGEDFAIVRFGDYDKELNCSMPSLLAFPALGIETYAKSGIKRDTKKNEYAINYRNDQIYAKIHVFDLGGRSLKEVVAEEHEKVKEKLLTLLYSGADKAEISKASSPKKTNKIKGGEYSHYRFNFGIKNYSQKINMTYGRVIYFKKGSKVVALTLHGNESEKRINLNFACLSKLLERLILSKEER